MKLGSLTRFIAFALVLGAFGHAEAAMQPGRALDRKKSFTASLTFGSIQSIEGSVQETKRAGASGVTTEGRFLENYDLSEFGLTDSYATIGLSLEKNWKYLTLVGDLKYFQIDATATARRDYAIGVDEISFGGASYEYMFIPDGRKFKSELQGVIAELKLQWTPFHLANSYDTVFFTPWLLAGVYAAGGDLKIDAGPATGTRLYEFDPFVYVIGGEAETASGVIVPEIGVGGEVRFLLAPRNDDFIELVLQAEFAFLDLLANTGDFGTSSRNEKDVDIEFYNFEARALLEVPLSPGVDLVAGLGVKNVDADATIEAQRRAPGETTTEKYDKDASIVIESWYGMVGLKF